MALYTKRKEENNKLAQTLLRSGIYTVFFFFLPNAMPPCTHFLFGWPDAVIWNFPFPVVYVKLSLNDIHFSKIKYFQPFFGSVPFSTETYAGFYFELFLQMFTVHFYMLIVSSTISMFHAFHILIGGLLLDYSMAFENFEEYLEIAKRKNSKPKNGRNRINVKLDTWRFLKNTIDLHNAILK